MGIGFFVALLAFSAGVRRAIRGYRRMRTRASVHRDTQLKRIQKAANQVTTCSYSVYLVKYSTFASHGKLIPHEEALARGDILALHLYEDVLSFVSRFPTALCAVSGSNLGLLSRTRRFRGCCVSAVM
eukprot:6972698-Prymnesium_polylepis.1